MDKRFLSGSITLLLLQLLAQKDMYGYEMIDALRTQSQQVFTLQAGTLYPLLHTLEHKGFVTSYDATDSAKPRKYYTLTPKGHRALADQRGEWAQYIRAVNAVLEGGQ